MKAIEATQASDRLRNLTQARGPCDRRRPVDGDRAHARRTARPGLDGPSRQAPSDEADARVAEGGDALLTTMSPHISLVCSSA